MKRLVEDETVIRIYQGNPEDSMTLLHWYLEIVASGEIDKILFPNTQSLGAFMAYFNDFGKVRMVYVPDDNNRIKFAAWGTAVSPGVIFLSIWLKPELRAAKEGAQITLDIYTELFKIFSVVQGITKQERLLKVHKKLGYKVIYKVPQGWDGAEDAWLVQMTKDDFLAACG